MVALATAVLLMVAGPTFATQADDPARGHELFDRVVFAAGPDHPGSEGNAVCTNDDAVNVLSLGGAAGVRENAYCTTGSHDPAIYSITHGPDAAAISSDFTGVVQSIIAYDGGERRWSCSYTNGVWVPPCQGGGAWPGQAVEFCHDVWAYETRGDVSQPLFTGFVTGCPNGEVEVGGIQLGANTSPDGDGIPTGSWGAYVTHA